MHFCQPVAVVVVVYLTNLFVFFSPVGTASLILSSSGIHSYIYHLLFFAASQLLFLSTKKEKVSLLVFHYDLRQSTHNTETHGKLNQPVIVIVPLKYKLIFCFLLYISFFFQFSCNGLSKLR